ncbi:hypothetical protein [Streptomyces qinzhouensis]|uniref:DUF3558 domain-containing protein n=1 Tax=Streptomyces qinzhouensis TaxID=2599401 RepID=A0A5B8IJZ0_9ACTN|nr:hypothetical protein [Streptomyces qinzhouensis]QDY78808.1 hypothetical protein FQU76_22425 [Streptomyces qinzhouensis]
MISEPELVGGDYPERGPVLPGPPAAPDPAEEYGDADDFDERLSSGREGRRPPLRPWQWGAAGAVLASLLWTGGLFAYRAADGGDPDPGPYRAVDDLCEPAAMKELTASLGGPGAPNPEKFRHPAMDQSRCGLTMAGAKVDTGALSSGDPAKGIPPVVEPVLSFSVQITYTLHRKTDPGPEFDAVARLAAERLGMKAEPVSGIGERAYRFAQEEGTHVLHVLDGQAELKVEVFAYRIGEEDNAPPPLPGIPGSQEELVADARALLEKLRGGRD